MRWKVPWLLSSRHVTSHSLSPPPSPPLPPTVRCIHGMQIPHILSPSPLLNLFPHVIPPCSPLSPSPLLNLFPRLIPLLSFPPLSPLPLGVYMGCKYLTSSELLSLQIRDPLFRQQLAAQLLFYVNHLRFHPISLLPAGTPPPITTISTSKGNNDNSRTPTPIPLPSPPPSYPHPILSHPHPHPHPIPSHPLLIRT